MYAYDDNGNRESITYPNGVKTTYTYDVLNRLIKQVSEKGATTLSSYTYVLSPNGQRQSMTEHTGRKSTYVYDKLNRLTAESITGVLNGNRVIAYSCDKVGNRQQQVVDDVTTAYIYNANDWVQSAGTIKYTYDSNGNTLTETDAGNGTTYVYDKKRKFSAAGAFDKRRGQGSAAYNGSPVRVSLKLEKHLNKVKSLMRGIDYALGTVHENTIAYQNGSSRTERITVGQCAEFRAANNLLRTGSRVKNILLTRPVKFYRAANLLGKIFVERDAYYCHVCQCV